MGFGGCLGDLCWMKKDGGGGWDGGDEGVHVRWKGCW